MIKIYVLSMIFIISTIILIDNNKRRKILSSNVWINIDRYSKNKIIKSLMFNDTDKICKYFEYIIKIIGIPKLNLIRFQTDELQHKM